MSLVETIRSEVLEEIEKYKNESEDHYDFWNEHIKYVVSEALSLTDEFGADKEIVELGALLHDIALIKKVGERKDHHINGEILAKEILSKHGYDGDKMARVLACVRNHRSAKNANSIEEVCVCDADILAHFDNIPMIFSNILSRSLGDLDAVRKILKKSFEKDYNDLSEKTKIAFHDRYNLICEIVIGNQRV
jgi:putative nucleotidyltransferase with HDIG domain